MLGNVMSRPGVFRNASRAVAAMVCLGCAALPVLAGRAAPGTGVPPRAPAALPAAPAPAIASRATREQLPVQFDHFLYLPILRRDATTLSVDLSTRQASLDFYQQQYLPSENVTSGWVGNVNSCSPGDSTPEFKAEVLRRINYFRAMAGVPAGVVLSDAYNLKAQRAALIMSANNELTHTVPADWQCYSADGDDAARSSNLALGAYGPDAVSLYMNDNGNTALGHRRWVLYPQTREMGTGDIPGSSGHWSANDLWVFDSNLWGPRPATRDNFVAWPPPGFVPYPVVFSQWSFGYPDADFSVASVTLSSGGTPIAVMVRPPVNGYGENTLVWSPSVTTNGGVWPRPDTDTTYLVVVHNVIIGGVSSDFAYSVTIFDPG
jgi:uncharacterized protein YkwD